MTKKLKIHHSFHRVVRGNDAMAQYISIPHKIPVIVGKQYSFLVMESSFQEYLERLGLEPGVIDGEGATLYSSKDGSMQIWLGKDGQLGWESEDKPLREALK